MRDLEELLKYSKEKVLTSQVPPSLYSKAEKRRAYADFIITATVAMGIILISTAGLSTKASIPSPVVREYLKHDLVATGELR